MKNISISELTSLRLKVIDRIRIARECAKLVRPHNSNLYLISLRQIGHLLLSLDLLDARILQLSNSTAPKVWTPSHD